MAKKLAHDIKQPLSALKAIFTVIDQLPTKERSIINNAIIRIENMTYEYIQIIKNSIETGSDNKQFEGHNLFILAQNVISELKYKYQNHSGIQLNLVQSEQAYKLFSKISPIEFQNILSNILTNSFESITSDNGEINLSLSCNQTHNIIEITDTGKGIPSHILSKIGKRPISYGKNHIKGSGTGQGLSHAFQEIEHWNGLIEISSKENIGTTVKISFPISLPPIWFPHKVVITKPSIAIINDDQSIHEIIKSHLSHFDINSIISFYNVSDFKSWISNNSGKDYIFLLDITCSELDLIHQHNLQGSSFIITDNFEDKNIQEDCIKLDIKMIPRPILNIIPFHTIDLNAKEFILIDDDHEIRTSWYESAKLSGITLHTFSSVSNFIHNSSSYDKEIIILVDSNLSNNLKGEIESQKIFNAGFKNIIIVTGDDIQELSRRLPSWVMLALDKVPIWC